MVNDPKHLFKKKKQALEKLLKKAKLAEMAAEKAYYAKEKEQKKALKILDKAWAKAEKELRKLNNTLYQLKVKENEYAENKAFKKKYALPKTGSFTCYKKARVKDGDYCLLTLKVPAEALRRTPRLEKKCRVSSAKVLKIQSLLQIGRSYQVAYSAYTSEDYKPIKYEVGKTVKCLNKFDTSNRQCSAGIHVFKNKEDAINY